MKQMLLAICFLAGSGVYANPTIKTLGGPLDFNAPVVQSKSNLTNLSPAGQIVFENTSGGFYGLATDGSWISFGQSASNVSQVRVDTSSTNGSAGVGDRVKVFTNSSSSGSDITYNPSGTNGDSFTINTTGIYAISYTGNASAGDAFTISLNASPAAGGTSLAAANALARCYAFGANSPVNCSWTGKLNSTNVIRAHQDGTTAGTASYNMMTITKIN